MAAISPTPKKGLNPGDHLRQYEIIRRLGEGGMGAVYLARDTKLGRRHQAAAD
jgi:serine/threonine protein kinase